MFSLEDTNKRWPTRDISHRFGTCRRAFQYGYAFYRAHLSEENKHPSDALALGWPFRFWRKYISPAIHGSGGKKRHCSTKRASMYVLEYYVWGLVVEIHLIKTCRMIHYESRKGLISYKRCALDSKLSILTTRKNLPEKPMERKPICF